MLVHEIKHSNVKHIAKSKLQFMVPILEIVMPGERGNAGRGVMPDTIIYKIPWPSLIRMFTALLSAKTAMTERPSQVARYFAFWRKKMTFILFLKLFCCFAAML